MPQTRRYLNRTRIKRDRPWMRKTEQGGHIAIFAAMGSPRKPDRIILQALYLPIRYKALFVRR